LAQFDAVVTISCHTPPRIKTRIKIQKLLQETIRHSNDEFDAKHDALTGLLNSRSVEALLKDLAASSAPPTGSDEPKILRATALIALDLDHFKQVNDSYGHAYGDIVLRCFSQRLRQLVNQFQLMHSDLNVSVARIGGEEFILVLDGAITSETAKQLAEEIRTATSDSILPQDEEWITHAGMPPVVPLPHASETKITVSVGLSSLITSANRSEEAIRSLRREADEALYRAKSGGRNTVRAFPEIRDRFGAILEHHADTDLVVIDIGSHLNVRVGNEFLVYHPDFTGEIPFVSSDGRTKKKLGTYPKLTCGRVIVFEVQSEIAFCRIAKKSVDRFPVGSSLEYIPVGSIAHLVGTDAQLGSTAGIDLLPASRLQKAIDDTIKPDGLSVIVFRLDNIESLERTRGVVFTNRVLAGLFTAIKKIVPRDALVGQLTSDTLAVVLRSKAKPEKLATQILTSAVARSGDMAKFGAGIYEWTTKKETVDGDKSQIDWKGALDLARYAALPAARESKSRIEMFTPVTAIRLLIAQNDNRKFREGRADYQAFKQLGVENWMLENQYALIEISERNWDAALPALVRALELKPTDNFVKANKAFTLLMLGSTAASHGIFAELSAANAELPHVYLRAEAMAAYAEFKKNPVIEKRGEVLRLLQNAKENGADITYYGIHGRHLEEAIAELSKLCQPSPHGKSTADQAATSATEMSP